MKNSPFIEKESDVALQLNDLVITERQYFVYNGSHCYRRKVYIKNNQVIAWVALYPHTDPDLHMSTSLADNPKHRLLVEFIMRRCGVPREQLIKCYDL